MNRLSQISFLRRLVLPILRKVNPGDITIRHHWTGDRLTLHSFRHKGYWYHGKRREIESMLLFSELIRKGDSVIEMGGHIGYISLYFAHLVGEEGQVTVFEPGENNLPYIRKNTESNPRISLIEQAVTDFTGTAKFFVEDLTGQNNSLLQKYGTFQTNKESAGIHSCEYSAVEVPCTTLDRFLLQGRLKAPTFIKIDVEGGELGVLKGMENTLKEEALILMVEVSENSEDVFSLLADVGFQMFKPDKSLVSNPSEMQDNIFCIRENNSRSEVFSF